MAHRNSRADRRRRIDPDRPAHAERRRSTPLTDAVIRSQVIGEQVQLFIGSPLMADNSAAARLQLDQHSRRVTTPLVVVDLEKCAYMDTPGLSLLFELRKTCVADHRQLILQNPSRPVQRILNITGMHKVFAIRQTSVDLERIPSAKQPAVTADTQTLIIPTK